MSLALAIPVKDDHAALAQLLRQAREMHVFDQVVIVDDGSSSPIETDGGHAGPWALPVAVLRHDHATGPGPARNRALAQITAEHFIYMDADDRLTSDFPEIWHAARMQDTHFDLCLFRHHDTRQEHAGRWGQMPQDDCIWHRAGVFGPGRPRIAAVDEATRMQLSETANYPWNKIYRTAFLRQHGIGCAPCLVHEDIPLHWGALQHAQTVLASPLVGVVHRVAEDGARLTNRRGIERLAVFDVLHGVLADLMATRAERDLVPAFWRFCSGLFEWIRGQIDVTLAPRYRIALHEFLSLALTPPLFDTLSRHDPVLALRLTLQMADAPQAEGAAFRTGAQPA